MIFFGKQPEKQTTATIIILLVALVLAFELVLLGMRWMQSNNLLTFAARAGVSDVLQSLTQNQSANASNPTSNSPNDAISDFSIDAKAFLSVKEDSKGTEVLFSKNDQERLPIASLTKLMTALLVLKYYDMNQLVTISPAAMQQEGVQGVLQEGQVLTVKDLLYISLIESSNRAAYALSEVIGNQKFVGMMNQEAEEMGLDNTHFADSTGLDSGSYSTASDLERIASYLYKEYPLFRQITGTKTYDLYLPNGIFHHQLQTTNVFLDQDGVIAGKTGYTDAAKGCFMIIQQGTDSSTRFIHIVLGAVDRVQEMQKFITWTNNHYQ